MADVLIENVEQHPLLYNYLLPAYKDQRARHAAWVEIARQINKTLDNVNITAEEAKARWDKLRRCFCNARNRRSSRNGGKTTVPWRYEKQMAFILPYSKEFSEKAIANLKNSKIDHEMYISDEDSQLEHLDITQHEIQELKTYNESTNDIALEQERQFYDIMSQGKHPEPFKSTGQLIDQNGSTSTRKRKLEDEETTVQHVPNHVQDMDDTDLFFLSLARTTKRFSKARQIAIKLKVSKIIFEAELEHEQATLEPGSSIASSTPVYSKQSVDCSRIQPQSLSCREVRETNQEQHQNVPFINQRLNREVIIKKES